MEPPTREIKVTKKWKNYKGDNLEKVPVEEIQVQLYKDGIKEGKVQKLSKSNNWEYTFKNLKDYEKVGKEIKKYIYTIKEVHQGKELENSSSTKFNGKWFKVTYKGDMKDGFKITNEEEKPWTPMEPPTRNIKVVKNWELLGTEKPAEKIEVELYRDGVATGKKLELNKTNNWSGEFKGLDVAKKLGSTNYYNYTVKEVGENANTIKLDGKWFKVTYTGDMKDGFKVINQEEKPWTPMEPPTRNIKVVKNWELLGTEKPVEEIEVELYRDGVATGKKLELTAGNNWSGEFKALDVADKLGSTNYYNYTVKEVGESGNSIKFDGKWFNVSYTGDMKDGFKIINKEEKPWTPEEPDKPNTPNTPEKPTPNTPKEPSKNLPKTGDGFNPSVYASVMVIAGGVLTLIGIKRRKEHEE